MLSFLTNVNSFRGTQKISTLNKNINKSVKYHAKNCAYNCVNGYEI